MLTKKVEDILVSQITKEAYSSSLYLAMASWAEVNGYRGVAEWFYAQSDEERIHMLKLVGYVNERGGKAIISQIEEPPADFGSLKNVFTKSLDHEQFISKSINDIVGVCMEEKDFTTHNWIQWFVNEQIEEEDSVHTILDKLNLVGEQNLYLFDRDIMTMRAKATGTSA
jgi:ferritin